MITFFSVVKRNYRHFGSLTSLVEKVELFGSHLYAGLFIYLFRFLFLLFSIS